MDVMPGTVEEVAVAIQFNCKRLSEEMRPRNYILTLYERGVLGPREKQELEKKDQNKGAIAQAESLLDMLTKREYIEALPEFVDVMYKENRDLFQIITNTIDQQREGKINFFRTEKCRIHKKDATEFCEQCGVTICESCIAGDHRNHAAWVIEDVEDKFYKMISPTNEDNWALLQLTVDERSKEIKESVARCTESVETETMELIDKLHQAKEMLIKQLKNQQAEQLDKLESAAKAYKNQKDYLEKKQQIIHKEWDAKYDGKTFLGKCVQYQYDKSKEIGHLCQELQSTVTLEVSKPTLEPGSLAPNAVGEISWVKEGTLNLLTHLRVQTDNVSSPGSTSTVAHNTQESDFVYRDEPGDQSTGYQFEVGEETTPKVPHHQFYASEETILKVPGTNIDVRARLRKDSREEGKCSTQTKRKLPISEDVTQIEEEDWFGETDVKVPPTCFEGQHMIVEKTEVKELVSAAGGEKKVAPLQKRNSASAPGRATGANALKRWEERQYEATGEQKQLHEVSTQKYSMNPHLNPQKQVSGRGSSANQMNKSLAQQSVKPSRQQTDGGYVEGSYQQYRLDPEVTRAKQVSGRDSSGNDMNESFAQLSVKASRQQTGGRYFEGNYLSDIKVNKKQEWKVKLNGECRRMAYIDHLIWAPIVDKQKIQIYRTNSQKVEDIIVKCPVAVCGIGEWIFVACEEEGIFQLQYNGNMERKIPKQMTSGSFSDVCSSGEKLFAWDYKCRRIFCWEKGPGDDGQYEVKLEIPVTASFKKKVGTSDKLVKLVVHQTAAGKFNFLLSDWGGHTILNIDENGIVLNKYGSKTGPGAAGLNNPLVCGVDAADNVLIADQKNNKFKVVNRTSGEWNNIDSSSFLKFVYDMVPLENGGFLSLGYDNTSVLCKEHI